MISKEEVYAKIDKAFDDIVKAALQWQPSRENAPEQAAAYPAKAS